MGRAAPYRRAAHQSRSGTLVPAPASVDAVPRADQYTWITSVQVPIRGIDAATEVPARLAPQPTPVPVRRVAAARAVLRSLGWSCPTPSRRPGAPPVPPEGAQYRPFGTAAEVSAN